MRIFGPRSRADTRARSRSDRPLLRLHGGVPFRLLTDQEEKVIGKNYGNIKKQVDAAFRKKA